MRIFFGFVLAALCSLPVLAQQQSVTMEFGREIYSTIPQAKGYKWVVRGNLYPAGTYTPAPGQPLPLGVCELPVDVQPIGQYAIFGERGDAADHTAQFVIRFDRKQLTFAGRLEFFEESPGVIGATLFRAVKLQNGVMTDTDPPTMVEFTPRSNACFGGTIRVFSE